MDKENDKPTVAPSPYTVEEGVLRSRMDLHGYLSRLDSQMLPHPNALVMSIDTFSLFAGVPFVHSRRFFDSEKCFLLGIPVQIGEYEYGYIGAIHQVSPTNKESHDNQA